MRVLLIEDDQRLANLIQRVLKDEGYNVDAAIYIVAVLCAVVTSTQGDLDAGLGLIEIKTPILNTISSDAIF